MPFCIIKIRFLVPNLERGPLFPLQLGAQPFALPHPFQADLEATPGAAVPSGAVGCDNCGGSCLCGSWWLHSGPGLELLSGIEDMVTTWLRISQPSRLFRGCCHCPVLLGMSWPFSTAKLDPDVNTWDVLGIGNQVPALASVLPL